MTRTEAEAKYSKLLESLPTVMETLETAVQAASNTKLEIKTAVRSMGVNIRDFTGLAKKLGMVRNPDATEQRVKWLQQRQMHQHSETFKLLSELKTEQARFLEAGLTANTGSSGRTLVQELEAVNLQLAEQGQKIEYGFSQTLELKDQIHDILQERRQTSQNIQKSQLDQNKRQPKSKQQMGPPPNKKSRARRKPRHHKAVNDNQVTAQSPPNGAGEDPGRSSDTEESTWTEVSRRPRGAPVVEPNKTRDVTARTEARSKVSALSARHKKAENLVRSRQPKTEAITISNPSAGTSYADVMKKVLSEVDLIEIGVEVTGTRRTKAGAILLEIKDKEGADRLAGKLRATIGEYAEVARPTRSTKVLLTNIPDWLEEGRVIDDIRQADAGLSAVPVTVRENVGGGRVAIITTTMTTALRLHEAGAIRVGMSKCRVKLLEGQKVRCFRCDGLGHMAGSCSAAPAEKKCFRCHQPGHLIANCTGVNPAKSKDTGAVSPKRAAPTVD